VNRSLEEAAGLVATTDLFIVDLRKANLVSVKINSS
jgi:hypothetical protein